MARSFTVAVTLNSISLISSGLTLLVSATVLSFLFKSLMHNHIDISLILLSNCYTAIFSCSLVLLINCIYILKGDYQIHIEQETEGCQIQGYVTLVLLSAVMNAFTVQVCLFCLQIQRKTKHEYVVGTISFLLYSLSNKTSVTKTNNICYFNSDSLDYFVCYHATCIFLV